MTLDFWKAVWIYFLTNCLLGFRLDTSRLPFSFMIKLIPFYKCDFDFRHDYEYDTIHQVMNYGIYLIIPYVCDIILIWQV